jgi:hypothetical protein
MRGLSIKDLANASNAPFVEMIFEITKNLFRFLLSIFRIDPYDGVDVGTKQPTPYRALVIGRVTL